MSEFELSEVHWLLDMINNVDVGMVVVDRNCQINLWNGFMESHSGVPAHKAQGKSLFAVLGDIDEEQLRHQFDEVFASQHSSFMNWNVKPFLTHFPSSRPITCPSEHMYQNTSLIPLRNPLNQITHICIIIYDVTDGAISNRALVNEITEREKIHGELVTEHAEVRSLMGELDDAHSQLAQSEKMASIGQLAAGVAHEINNPVGFISSNIYSLKGYTEDLLELIATYEATLTKANLDKELTQTIEEKKSELDIEFLKEDVTNLVAESLDGTDRVKKIVNDLKDFSRVGQEQWEASDLVQGIESTLTICSNEIKYKAEVVKDYSALPLVECIPSQINQVILNLLVNAAQAIDERGQITLATRLNGDTAEIEISDTGKGIAEENLSKIFDPFFTTKPIGKGTGLGLSLSYGIIQRHHGTLSAKSKVGEGTSFLIRLPLTQPAEEGEEPLEEDQLSA